LVDKQFFNWKTLHLEGWCEERKIWCKIVEMNIFENTIGLTTGTVTFWLPLDKTKFRMDGAVLKKASRFPKKIAPKVEYFGEPSDEDEDLDTEPDADHDSIKPTEELDDDCDQDSNV
jgi:hypothetical protein